MCDKKACTEKPISDDRLENLDGAAEFYS